MIFKVIQGHLQWCHLVVTYDFLVVIY